MKLGGWGDGVTAKDSNVCVCVCGCGALTTTYFKEDPREGRASAS